MTQILTPFTVILDQTPQNQIIIRTIHNPHHNGTVFHLQSHQIIGIIIIEISSRAKTVRTIIPTIRGDKIHPRIRTGEEAQTKKRRRMTKRRRRKRRRNPSELNHHHLSHQDDNHLHKTKCNTEIQNPIKTIEATIMIQTTSMKEKATADRITTTISEIVEIMTTEEIMMATLTINVPFMTNHLIKAVETEAVAVAAVVQAIFVPLLSIAVQFAHLITTSTPPILTIPIFNIQIKNVEVVSHTITNHCSIAAQSMIREDLASVLDQPHEPIFYSTQSTREP